MIKLSLDDFDRSGHKSAYIDDAAYDLEIGYRALGFPFTSVTYAISGDPVPDEVRFMIDEGPRTLLQEVRFVGMKHLTRANFDNNLTSKRTSTIGRSRPYFVERDVRSALVAMEREYLEFGYLNATIELTSVGFDEDRTAASIVATVNEGSRYRIDKVDVVSSDLPAEQLSAYRGRAQQAADLNDRVWRARTGFELRGLLLEALASAGHADAAVAYSKNLRDNEARVDLKYEITSGPVVRIAQVVFTDGLHTRAGFLHSRVTMRSGDVYSSEAVRESVRSLYGTGLFKRVSIELEETESVERNLLVELVEAPTGEVFVEPSYGSYERLRLRLGFRQKNLWGTGRLLRVETTLGDRAQRGAVTLTDPWFLGSKFSADLAFRYDRRELPSFTDESQSAGVFWTRDWNDQHSTSFGYQFRRSKASDVTVVDADIQAAQDQINIASVQATQSFDSRGNFFLPEDGWFNEAAVEFGDESMGSELNFLRTSLRLSTFGQPIGQTVLAGSFRTGVIQPVESGATIPLQERYFNGGQSTVRSFRFGELGPKDAGGNALGGESYATANLEVRQPLSARFQGAVFVDAGNVTPRHEDYFDFADIQYGVGLGLRYLLPIGPVRLDVGFNPDRSDGDPTYVVHFSIGMAF